MSVQTDTTGAGKETVSQVEKTTSETKPGNDWVDTLESGPESKKGEQSGKTEGKDPLDGIFTEDKKASEAAAESNEKPKQEGETGDAIDIKFPEGFQADPNLMEGFLSVIKDGGSKQEQAQKLIDMYAAEQKKTFDVFSTEHAKTTERINNEWLGEIKNDPEFGGEKYEESCNHVIAAIRRFVPATEMDSFLGFFKQANLKNNPQLFRFFARVSQYSAEAGAVASDASNPERELSRADRMFPNLPSALKK